MEKDKFIIRSELEFSEISLSTLSNINDKFNQLLSRVGNGKRLLEYEKDFFCRCISAGFIEGKGIADYPCCENFIFKWTYLVYKFDITGGGFYRKISKEKGRELVSEYIEGKTVNWDAIYYTPTAQEMTRDLEYLYKEADDWEKIVSNLKHSDQVLQVVCKETREILKKLNEQKASNPYYGAIQHKLKQRHELLQSKYCYLMTKEIIESMDEDEHILKLNGQEIEYRAFSIFHILRRHYSPGTKHYDLSQSFIGQEFVPRQLHIRLSDIFSRIDNSGLYSGESVCKVVIRYKNVLYDIWSEEKEEGRNGKQVKYKRLQSFYPIKNTDRLQELASCYVEKKIDDELSVFVAL